MGTNASDDLFSSEMFAARGKGDPLVGTRIDEYRLESLLGSGGMARVYRAVDVNLNRSVAIKVIDTPYQTDAGYARRFKREAQAIAQLEHPHIVRLYRYGQAGGLFYMAMQFIRGVNLGELLQIYHANGTTLTPDEAARVIREVGDALDYSHNMGVIHRDVKASNIIINQQGRAVLVDFGLAMLADQSATADEFGSPHYLAPEQAMPNGRITPLTDLYSLGVTLYEMLTGQRPYSALDPYSLAQKHIHEEPPAPTTLRPEISPAVEHVILKALSKSPRGRYQSGQALADALEHALLEEPFPTGANTLQLTALDGPPQKLADLVRQRMEAVSAPPAAPAPAASAASAGGLPEPPSPTQTRLSWDEQQRRADPAGTVVPPAAAVGPAAARPVARRRSALASPAIIALLAVMMLCLGASVLTAVNNLRRASLGADPTPAAVIVGAGESLTDTPPGAGTALGGASEIPPGAAVVPSATDVIPNTGVEVTSTVPGAPGFGAATATPLGMAPQPTNTAGLLPTVIVVTPTSAQPGVIWPTATRASIRPTVTNPPTALPPAATRTRVPPTATQPPPTAIPQPTAADTPVPPTNPPPPTATAEQPVLPDPVYLVSITRRGEDEGWMVITNTGATNIPLATFRVDSRKGGLGAGSWGADSLPPGGCLVAWRENRQGDGLPPGAACSQVGSAAVVENSNSGIFKDEITVSFEGQAAGSCGKDEYACGVQLQ